MEDTSLKYINGRYFSHNKLNLWSELD